MKQQPSTSGLLIRIIGGGLLVLGLPLAFMAITALPNEYEATLGIRGALDCDGPAEVYMSRYLLSSFMARGLATTCCGGASASI